MSNKTTKTLSLAMGAAFVGSFALAQQAEAASFALTDLDAGYMQVGDHGDDKKGEEGKCGEGKCGEDKKGEEGKCGEGKCGEGKCGEDKDKGKEGSCGGAV